MKSKRSDTKSQIVKILKNKTILITGGAGSVGFTLTKKLLEYPVRSIRVLDMDEHALFRLKHKLNDPRLRLLLGSVLDKDRIERAGTKTDIIFHIAAVKNIEISEYNPIETIETNINGTVNMIKMAISNKPKIFINVSTDKAVEATTLYGTTKQLSERLTSWAGVHIDTTKFASVRFGNVIDSRGNVFEIWKEQLKSKQPLSITHPASERYFFSSIEAVDFILRCLSLVKVGEVFIPKMKLYNIKEMANKFSKKHKIIGLRQGEKLKEVLISESEKELAEEKKDMWIIRCYGKERLNF